MPESPFETLSWQRPRADLCPAHARFRYIRSNYNLLTTFPQPNETFPLYVLENSMANVTAMMYWASTCRSLLLFPLFLADHFSSASFTHALFNFPSKHSFISTLCKSGITETSFSLPFWWILRQPKAIQMQMASNLRARCESPAFQQVAQARVNVSYSCLFMIFWQLSFLDKHAYRSTLSPSVTWLDAHSKKRRLTLNLTAHHQRHCLLPPPPTRNIHDWYRSRCIS